MRITKKDLKHMVLEVLSEQEEEEVSGKITTGRTSAGQYKKSGVETASDIAKEKEVDTGELDMIKKIQDFLVAMAKEGDLKLYRQSLQVVLQTLAKKMKPKQAQPEESPQGEEI